ncbi:MAG: bifunctional hydroxymethylpyrimidine kinase/phosphomethylpyrimidine kinase, partial [Bacilli bacterium]|nr:bifunctional hydroxymethylpyrimidine kinase/phosphomethylpyrimidine kinase [Bacilli bacterium]
MRSNDELKETITELNNMHKIKDETIDKLNNDIHKVVDGLLKIGAKNIVLTGISYHKGMTGVLLYSNGKYQHYEHEKIDKNFHGTGDVYASALLGIYLATNDLFYSAKKAAEFVVKCINNTIKDESHWYGVKFEPLLAEFVNECKKG